MECNICGEPLAAATEDELVRQVRENLEAEHPDSRFDEDSARTRIARAAYDAADD